MIREVVGLPQHATLELHQNVVMGKRRGALPKGQGPDSQASSTALE